VDDTKISHEDSKAVSHVIQKIEARFGEMAVTGGKEHVFLGMNISFRNDGTASIVMKDYIKEAIAHFRRTSHGPPQRPQRGTFLKSKRTASL
jgi:hypothetical protein